MRIFLKGDICKKCWMAGWESSEQESKISFSSNKINKIRAVLALTGASWVFCMIKDGPIQWTVLPVESSKQQAWWRKAVRQYPNCVKQIVKTRSGDLEGRDLTQCLHLTESSASRQLFWDLLDFSAQVSGGVWKKLALKSHFPPFSLAQTRWRQPRVLEFFLFRLQLPLHHWANGHTLLVLCNPPPPPPASSAIWLVSWYWCWQSQQS